MGQVLAFSLVVEHACNCIVCSVPIFMDAARDAELQRNHGNFFCVNGHSQRYIDKSDLEKLRDQLGEKERLLAAERARASTNFLAREKAERELKKVKRRVSQGICPCCNRTFTESSLARHIKTKHPEFVKAAP